MKKPVWLAIDTPELQRARSLAVRCAPHLAGVKLGLEFFSANGPDGVRAVLQGSGLPLFLDLKFHDIPNTVAKAIESVAPLSPALLTIHAAGGREMIRAARAAAPSTTRIICVTVLTSLDGNDLSDIGVGGTPQEQVTRLAALVREAGADGVVCSPHEAAAVRASWPEAFLVVPGVRPAGAVLGDQKRVRTPAQALAAGASALVVGRPITTAADPAEAARDIADSL